MSGTAALTAEENLNPVPGAAAAETFTIYLPSPDPLGAVVSAAVGRARPPVRAPPRRQSRRPRPAPRR